MKHQDIPNDYLHCFATKEQCRRCENCLHRFVADYPDQFLSPVHCVNPLYIKKFVERGDECRHFQEKRLVRYGKGFTRMFDNLPRKAGRDVERLMRPLFGGRTTYYRCRNGERLVDEELQQQIANLFHRAGILGEPQFDDYEVRYKWF